MARTDLLSRLADAGEDAINRLADTPGADRLVGVANNMRDRMDELQKKVRGIEELEKRVAQLEKRLGTLEKQTRPGTRRASAAKTSSARKTTSSRSRSGSASRSTSSKPKS